MTTLGTVNTPLGRIRFDPCSTLANGERTGIPMAKSSGNTITVYRDHHHPGGIYAIHQYHRPCYWPANDLDYLKKYWADSDTNSIPIMKRHLYRPFDEAGRGYLCTAYIRPQYVGFSGTLSYESHYADVKPHSYIEHASNSAIIYFKKQTFDELPHNEVLFVINNPYNAASILN